MVYYINILYIIIGFVVCDPAHNIIYLD